MIRNRHCPNQPRTCGAFSCRHVQAKPQKPADQIAKVQRKCNAENHVAYMPLILKNYFAASTQSIIGATDRRSESV